jgi:hypothetical protein
MYDDDLVNLDEWLRRLRIEYLVYFNGNRKKPPDDLRMRVEKLVKRLSECANLSYSQRFRYNTLVARFYVYRDLWRRTLQERELGLESKAGSAKDKPAPSMSKLPVEAVRISISDPKADEEKIQQLYNALLNVRKTGSNEPSISYEQFAKYITNQTLGIRGKLGCSSVVFTIYLEEDAIRFTAGAENS